MQIIPIQVAFMAGDCFVDGYFLHIAIALVVIAAFYHRIAVPAGTLYTLRS